MDLEWARVERLAREIAGLLVAGHGRVTRRASVVDDVDRWCRAARRVGRPLGGLVRTGVATDGSKVWVVEES